MNQLVMIMMSENQENKTWTELSDELESSDETSFRSPSSNKESEEELVSRQRIRWS